MEGRRRGGGGSGVGPNPVKMFAKTTPYSMMPPPKPVPDSAAAGAGTKSRWIFWSVSKDSIEFLLPLDKIFFCRKIRAHNGAPAVLNGEEQATTGEMLADVNCTLEYKLF